MNATWLKTWLFPAALSLAAALGCDMGPPAGGGRQAATEPTGPPPIATEPVLVQEKASVDLTRKGQAAAEYKPGLITTPAKAYLRVRDRIPFEIQIPSAMNLYKAEHDSFPKTQEQFMQDIIKANQIQLPELPPDSKYVYKPETGELMIEHPE
jgi:hypothetical protein